MIITEGISSVWHYHLSYDGKHTKALCGADTMSTAMTLDMWGMPFGEHFPKRPTWCRKCHEISMEKKENP